MTIQDPLTAEHDVSDELETDTVDELMYMPPPWPWHPRCMCTCVWWGGSGVLVVTEMVVLKV